jgi:SAM-dependent methyltransferase
MVNDEGAKSMNVDTLQREEAFHDSWASSVDSTLIDVIKSNEVCTAPEMRFITSQAQPLKGKRLLDVGCGLGEASVYFARLGAQVTSLDLSEGMLQCTKKLSLQNGVEVETHKASAESFDLGERKFDLIYVGNLFHHVDIEDTIIKIKRHLAPNGRLLSWDPVAYNPLINIYRRIATDTRTPDEHPLRKSDVEIFEKHFAKVNVRFFWLTTLVIFILMFAVQRRNPNKERFWKKVVDEGDKWKYLYVPLEKLDRALLTVFPFLGWLCWNVVVTAESPKDL